MQVPSEGRATGVLSALQNLFLRGPRSSPRKSAPIPEVIRQFVAARQLSGNPVLVHHWLEERNEQWSYLYTANARCDLP